jgi:hypothetical protein
MTARLSPALRAALLVGVLAIPVAAPVLAAQTRQAPPPRRSLGPGGGARLLKNTLVGALGGTALAMGYYAMSEKGDRGGGCEPLSCALPYLSVSGALAGMFIGREKEAARRAESPRTGSSFEFNVAQAETRGAPNALDVRDSLVAVVTDSGTQILSATARPVALRSRAAGLSNLRQVAILPSKGSVLLGTGTALWEASLASGPASRIADGPIDALAASDDAVLAARGSMLRLRRGAGASERVDSLDMGALVGAVAWDATGSTWWVATDSAIVQVTGTNGLQRGVTLRTPAAARSVTTHAGWVAAALGDEGVIAWRRDAVASGGGTPVRLSGEPRFAYDLAFLGDELFVAGGVDGLYRLRLAPDAAVLGSSRQFPFATTVRASGGALWVGDRTRKAVVRVVP